MPFCLPQFATDALKEKFISGEITPEKLLEIKDSNVRRELFAKIIGAENAKQVNALFESKIPLKNQQLGLVNWGERVLGLKDDVHYKDFLDRVKSVDEFMSPQKLDMFLEDAIERRLKVHVSIEEIGKLTDLAKRVETFKAEVDKLDNTSADALKYESKADEMKRMEYGVAAELFDDYARSLKPQAKDLTFKEFITTPSKIVTRSFEIAKSIVASLDNSLWGNQGISTLIDPKTTHIWVKGFMKSWGNMGKALVGIDPILAAKAKARSRPDAINGTFKREKIALSLNSEEAFPTSIPERLADIGKGNPVTNVVFKPIQLLGRFFKASSSAYNAGALELRVKTAEQLNKTARENGVDLFSKKNAEAIGHLVNSATGRGSLGKGEPIAPLLNVYMFSAKLLKGTFDTLTAHVFDPKVRSSPFAQRQAAFKLMRMTVTYIATMSLIEGMNPGSTDMDPRSPHFGQIKIGGTYFNTIGPYRPIIRTLSSLIPTFHDGKWGLWKKDEKGKWRDLTDGKFGQYNGLDMAEQFLENKASPGFRALMDYWRGKNFAGDKPTLESTGKDLITPITIKNYLDDKDNSNVENIFINSFINGLGFSATTPK